jgi:hypothetical protein
MCVQNESKIHLGVKALNHLRVFVRPHRDKDQVCVCSLRQVICELQARNLQQLLLPLNQTHANGEMARHERLRQHITRSLGLHMGGSCVSDGTCVSMMSRATLPPISP